MSVERARQLRKTMSAPEVRLWTVLRVLRPLGYHFRRQVPLGAYFADFCCHKAKLVVEVDGDLHFDDASVEYDNRRDELLRNEGYRVLRVTNHDVMRNIDGVLTVIRNALDQPPPSIPPHRGEGSQPGGCGQG